MPRVIKTAGSHLDNFGNFDKVLASHMYVKVSTGFMRCDCLIEATFPEQDRIDRIKRLGVELLRKPKKAAW